MAKSHLIDPYKLSDQVAALLVKAYRAGLSKTGAARLAGIDVDTLNTWRAAGRAALQALRDEGKDPLSLPTTDLPRLAALELLLDQALGEWEAERLLKIAAAATADWRAAAWQLERRLPTDYGKRTQVDHVHVLVNKAREVAQARGLDEAATEELVKFVLERERRRGVS